ncbi:hypothetical protein HS088_TW06G01003 [Tripterygium wilfordii]|uniref:Uncharacterized protein n=1 Tax=Tripterygium wilfordii TaxID=458696 RepID=A0A7J7DKJ4_TRIWF|nr:uncharacterized protein LOC119999396 [Tripterygium wilfordii]KAF5746828.1 hypothetical protein HS088_TW06G01003 [Tripterygium wilfordii]
MGNGYNHHQTLHNLHHKTTFLPLLCSRPSIKDVAIPRWEDRSSSSSNDPLSPRIGCMGQVKRNDKFNLGFHPSRKATKNINNNSNNSSPVKYFKLRKIFSGKNYSVNTSSIATSTTNNNRRRRGGSFDCGSEPKIVDGKENSGFVNIVEMDPPLPVIRKVKPATYGGGETAAESLWKRRSGGVALQSLRLQQIQINRHGIEPTTV